MKQSVFLISMLILTAALLGWSGNYAALKYNSCKTEIDSITKKLIYTVADTEPMNEGGKSRLLRELERNIVTSNFEIDTTNHDPNVIVAFIVDNDGSIKGERIINDKTQKVGKQMLDIIMSLKWTPAKCNGKLVPMLIKQKLVIDIMEN